VTFLFWNLFGKPLAPLVASLVKDRRIDVLMLAENSITDADLLTAINSDPAVPVLIPPTHYPAGGLRIFTNLPLDLVDGVTDESRFSILHLKPPLSESILLVVVHLPSKLRMKDVEQAIMAPRVSEAILEAEDRVGHSRTVLVGDFNMNPFEVGLVASENFHAVMTTALAQRGSRTVGDKDRKFFYNPMWNHFGDRETPGTYYRDGGPVSYFWNMFDQVLIRPDLLPRFKKETVEIVTTAGATSLLSRSRRPDSKRASDHLPILFRLD